MTDFEAFPCTISEDVFLKETQKVLSVSAPAKTPAKCKRTRAFDKECAAKLAASDKRCYYDQESMIKKTTEDEIVESASHSKILTEPRSERNEGRTIV